MWHSTFARLAREPNPCFSRVCLVSQLDCELLGGRNHVLYGSTSPHLWEQLSGSITCLEHSQDSGSNQKKQVFEHIKRKLFIFGCIGSSLICEGFLSLQQLGLLSNCGARPSHCGAQAQLPQGMWDSPGPGVDQGLHLCLLLWQADSEPLEYQRSPRLWTFKLYGMKFMAFISESFLDLTQNNSYLDVILSLVFGFQTDLKYAYLWWECDGQQL